MKPETKQKILSTNPRASAEDIREYERLLSLRFTVDPNAPAPPARPVAREGDARAAAPQAAPEAPAQERERRLAELHRKLFVQG